jgi:hypothetical protein
MAAPDERAGKAETPISAGSKAGSVAKKLVLPDRIELSTSPLPMECSTTELRQHARYLRGIGPNGRPLGGRFLPQGPLWRKRAGGPERDQNRQKSALVADKLLQSGQLPRKLPRKLAGPIRFPTIRGRRPQRRIMTLHGLAAAVRVIAARGGETHYGLTVALRAAWCPFGPRHIRRTDDEGRSRQACGKAWRGCEGFTTGPAEAGVARKSQAAEVASPRPQRCRYIFRKRRCLPR